MKIAHNGWMMLSCSLSRIYRGIAEAMLDHIILQFVLIFTGAVLFASIPFTGDNLKTVEVM